METGQIEIVRRDRVTHGEYLAHFPGRPGSAKLSWTSHGNVRHAEHTIVPPEWRGRGVAGELVDALIADARREGFKISPDCSYVAAKFDANPDWADLRA